MNFVYHLVFIFSFIAIIWVIFLIKAIFFTLEESDDKEDKRFLQLLCFIIGFITCFASLVVYYLLN